MLVQNVLAPLFGHPDLHIDQLDIQDHRLRLTLISAGQQAVCPSCGAPSHRVHSRYTRTARDLPWATFTVLLCLVVRRFRCTIRSCSQKIFAERLSELIDPRARLTRRLNKVLLRVALTVGAEPGQRLLAQLGVHVGSDKLLELSHAVPLPTPDVPAVIGIDDFAFRRGQTYGTVVVDLAKGKPLALLPDRSAETVAEWLQAHPNVTVVSRDRSTEYERAVHLGAPDAQHVLDRWHVLKNLREALERTCRRHQALIHEIGRHGVSELLARQRTQREETSRQLALERRHRRIQEVKQLHNQGRNIAQIAQELRCSRTFVRVCVRMDQLPVAREKRRLPNPLAEHLPYLTERWNAGNRNAVHLLREVQAQGFTGTYRRVYEWTVAMRNVAAQQPNTPVRAPSPEQIARDQRGFSPRQLSWLLVFDEGRLDGEKRSLLDSVKERSPELGEAHRLAQRLRALFRDQDAGRLTAWLDDAQKCALPELQTFATGLRREQGALSAAISMPWSNGPTEGVVNRIKLVKRQMYGRGSLDLLRRRVLLAA